MSTKRPGWEGTLLAFAMIFTVLIGLGFMFGAFFRFAVPWLAILTVSALIALGLRYLRRPGT